MKFMDYGGIPRDYTILKKANVVILPVPYDGTSTWNKGADKGPKALLEASANMELYDIGTDSEVFRIGMHTAPAIMESASPEAMYKAVYGKVRKYLKDDKFVITIGGEHSVSIGAIEAHRDHFENLMVLQIDAHTDLRHSYEGSKYNHACVMARVREMCPFVQVGIRSMDISEKESLPEGKVFYASDIRNDETQSWINDVVSKMSGNIYVTIDLDGLDPSVLPSTGTPEPDGLLYHEVINLLSLTNQLFNIVGFDIVELCPNPWNKSSDLLAAKLLYQFCGMVFKKKGVLK